MRAAVTVRSIDKMIVIGEEIHIKSHQQLGVRRYSKSSETKKGEFKLTRINTACRDTNVDDQRLL